MNDSNGNIASNVNSFEETGFQSENDWKICDKKPRKTSKVSLNPIDETFNLSKDEKNITDDAFNKKNIVLILQLLI